MAEQPDVSELSPYLEAGYQLIPLHRFDKYDTVKGKSGKTVKKQRGKSPFHNNWTTRNYSSKASLPHMKKGSNVGVRLRPTDLVIDVDPRNFEEGDDPLVRLAKDMGLELDDYPTVTTGSGGKHIYLKKPPKLSTLDTVEGYDGVEFKTVGRQVVAAGSIHPDAKKKYLWDTFSPHLKDAPRAPKKLLLLIRRPKGAKATGGGEYSKEQLATMLDKLDPGDFQDHDDWLKLMQACHHATAGDGRDEFVEWSTSDPEYQDDMNIIGRRWDSLHADANGNRITHRTLNKILIDADASDVIPRDSAADDFGGSNAKIDENMKPKKGEKDKKKKNTLQDDGELDEIDVEDLSPLDRMNEKYWAVTENGKFRIMYQELDPSQHPPRDYWVRMAKQDFDLLYANKRMQGNGNNTIPMSQAWLEWPKRRAAKGVVFDPEGQYKGYLNLWTGWGFDPVKREDGWKLLQEMLFEVLCNGDQAMFEYVLNWSAYFIQHPSKPAEVAICFQGPKGIGKGTFGRALVNLAGRHGMQITSSEQFTGRFNDHLRDLVLLFADEAVRPYDKSAESRLKGLITEPTLAYEGKGRDIIQDRNRLHVVMASNEDWFVPIDMAHERRFAVTKGNTAWQNRLGRFGELNTQLETGGYEAMLWDLQNRKLGDWAPRRDIPMTEAFADQRMRNMDPIAQWWMDVLVEGDFDFVSATEEHGWEDGSVKVFKQDMKESFVRFCRERNINAASMNRLQDNVFSLELKRVIPDLKVGEKTTVPEDRIDIRPDSSNRARCFRVPALGACRERMDAILGIPYAWEQSDEDDNMWA